MRRILNIFSVIAFIAIIGFTLAGCEGPMGPPGERGPQDPPVLVLQIDTNVPLNEVTILRGRTYFLEALVYPLDATVQTLAWQVDDIPSNRLVSIDTDLSGRFAIWGGNSVRVTGLLGGTAKIRVTALGSGNTEVYTIVEVTVVDVAQQVAALYILNDNNNLPASATIVTTIEDEPIAPQLLYFGGNPITITLTTGEHGGDTLLLDRVGSMFTVGDGVTLILEDIKLRGIAANSGYPVVLVSEGGTLVMNEDGLIFGNTNPLSYIMQFPEGRVRRQGGGVRVDPGGTFNMNDGEISGNSAALGAGVHNRGLFNMTGGLITQNNATILGGGGVSNYSGGVFNMTGGRIYRNSTSSGMSVAGGGVRNIGTFTMSGGRIYFNTTPSIGGGVSNMPVLRFEHNPVFNMEGSAIISNNTAVEGGGVNNNLNGVFNMSGGTITENSANSGGGVTNFGQLREHTALFNMTGGTISENTAGGVNQQGNPLGRGGGILNAASAVLNMIGGTITENSANLAGGGIDNAGGVFQISDGRIYGIDDPAEANTAPTGASFAVRSITIPGLGEGEVLFYTPTSRRGTFSPNNPGGEFTPVGSELETTNNTMIVIDGDL
ncbi:MAG: hypothetical protein FWC97_00550 [Treponema sp.]|nr:hypothetical protein [Treponema sp.]